MALTKITNSAIAAAIGLAMHPVKHISNPCSI